MNSFPVRVAEVIGEAQLIKEIEKYQQLWLREHVYWKKAERDIEDIHASMAGIQTDVEDLKQAVPVVASNVGSLQEDIAGNQRNLVCVLMLTEAHCLSFGGFVKMAIYYGLDWRIIT